MLMAIARRKLSGRHFAVADREHIHHCMQDLGLSKRQALLALSSLTLVLSLSATATSLLQNDLIAIATCAVTLSALVGCRIFGHREATMLISRVRTVAAHRLKTGQPAAADQRDAAAGDTDNAAEAEPLIFKLPIVDQAVDEHPETRVA